MTERIWRRKRITITIAAGIMLLATSPGWSGFAAGPTGRLMPEPILQDQVTTCMREFELAVRQGPNAGLRLAGTLVLNVGRGGRINDGLLIRHDEGEIRVTGQVTGRAINLIFDLGNGRLIFGVGTLETEIGLCTGAMGGPLVGPFPGDFGDWIAGEGQVLQVSLTKIFTSETARHDIRIQTSIPAPQERYAGIRDTPGFVNGQRLQALFNGPFGMGYDTSRDILYVADTGNQAIRRIQANGNVSTVVSKTQASAVAGVSTFGVRGLAVDINGNLFISDNVNHVMWYFNTSTNALTLLAGSPGQPGLRDGRGTAARLNKPDLTTISTDGRSVVVSDLVNHVVRLVTAQGDVTTLNITPP